MPAASCQHTNPRAILHAIRDNQHPAQRRHRHWAFPDSTPSGQSNTVTKEQLRAELERQAQRYKDVYAGKVVTYAAQPEPDRKPWRKRPSLLDQAFSQELEKMQKEQLND